MICRQNNCFSLGNWVDDRVRSRRVLSYSLVSLTFVMVSTIIAARTHGVPISYPDQFGTDVDYINIRENSVTDPGPLFGAPSVSGNQLEFNPTAAFEAATSGGGFDITDGQLNFDVSAHDGSVIDNFMLIESGIFTLSGAGTATTAVSVSTPTLITITEVDGVALVPSVQIAINMIFIPVGNAPSPFGNYNLTSDAGVETAWSGSLSADITQKLIDENIDFSSGATKIEVVLDNIFTAISEAGTTAEISKGDFVDIVILTNIPEPATCGLALIGFLAIASVRRQMK